MQRGGGAIMENKCGSEYVRRLGSPRSGVHNKSELDEMAFEQYKKLTPENKEKVNRFVESLKADQYNLAP